MPLLILSLLRNNWKPIFIFLCFSLWSIGCYQQGARNVQGKWDLANAEAVIKARGIEHDNTLISNLIGGKYESSIDAINNAYNTAISLQPTASGDMSRTPKPTSKFNATACTDSVYKTNARLKLAKESEINTQKLIALQEWQKSVK